MFAIARNFSGKNCEKLWPRPTLDEVSAIGRCSAGVGLLRHQDAVGWHIVQRARVGDAAVPVGRHLVIVRGGAAALGVTVTALFGLRRELEILRCVLGRVTIAHCCGARPREVGSAGGMEEECTPTS